MPCYTSKDGDREAILDGCQPVLDKIQAFWKGHGKTWLCGDSLMWLDFFFFEVLDYLNFIAKGDLFERNGGKYSSLKGYHQRFIENPKFAAVWADDKKCMKYPFNNAMAAIGGRDSKF